MKTSIVKAIKEDVGRLMSDKQFSTLKVEEEPFAEKDLLLINNSFLFRSSSTSKSEKYLALRAKANKKFEDMPFIATGVGINKDLRKISSKSTNIYLTDLDKAIDEELDNLGVLLFVLVGEVNATLDTKASINLHNFKHVRWSNSAKETIKFTKDEIVVNQPHDIELIWSSIETHCQKNNKALQDNHRELIIGALQDLQAEAFVQLKIPKRGTSISENAFIDHVTDKLERERNAYNKALKQWIASSHTDESAYDQLLKISYNFVSDALRLLELIVSICDLKPIVLWGTVAEHFQLSEAFRNLFWTRTSKKAFLKDYKDVISTARNKAFHNLFPFETTIEVLLPNDSVQGVRLKIFTEYARQNNNKMMFKDKELADVFLQFTRAHVRHISVDFWKQNLKVIDATLELFTKTGEFLRLLLAVQ
jgi:hypothetical protein